MHIRTMHNRFVTLLLLLVVVHSSVQAADNFSGLYSHVSFFSSLTDRTTGSPGSVTAAEYIKKRFHDARPATMDQVDFSLPLRRHNGSTLFVDGTSLPLTPLYYNAITPQNIDKQGLSGELIYVKKGTLTDFNGLNVAGAIVLMDFDSGRNWLNAASLGAAALIYVGDEQADRSQFVEKEELSPIQFPCFWLTRKDIDQTPALHLPNAPAFLHHKVTLTSSVIWEKGVTSNIYALFAGTDKTKQDQLLMVEAFYDASSFLPGKAPGADESLSIAALLELADFLHHNPPERPFLLVATSGHHQELAGMRELIWTASVGAKDLRKMENQIKQDTRQCTTFINALHNQFHGTNNEASTLDGLVLQKSLRSTLKLEIDQLSNQLIKLRMAAEAGENQQRITTLAHQRLMLRQFSWKTDFSDLTSKETHLLQPLAERAIHHHQQVLEELQQQERMLQQSRKFRSLLEEYEPRAIISLHLSSHGSGLGAFEHGFMYPLRSRINRTGAFRTIDETLLKTAAQAPPTAPVFVSTLRPNRLNPWQDMLPDKPKLGGEISCLAGLPGFSLVTTNDIRSSWSTPFDTIDHINWKKAKGQWELARSLIMGLDKAAALPLGYIRNGFSTVSGKSGRLLHGELFAEQPAPETMLLAFQGRTRYHLLTDLQGRFLLKGVADNKHVQDKVILEGYKFSATDHQVNWAIDKKLTGKSAYRIKMQRQNMRTDLVMFNCRQMTIFNLLEPRSLRYMSKLQLLDGRREAPPLRYWYSRIDTRSSTIASLFLEPGTRMKLTLSDTILKKKMILTNASDSNPLGSGYVIDAHPSLYNTNYLSARDQWNLLKPRIANLEKHGIHNERIADLQQQGIAALNLADQALEAKQYNVFSEAANTSWALASRVYDHVESTQKDVLFGVLFYIALFVPFAFCMERLLFGYASIYKRIIAFSTILILLIAVIAQVHPAFALAYSPTVVILAFFIIGLSFLVTMIIVLRFENEMLLLQRRASHKRPVEISTWKAFIAAFYLGVSNLRRRKLRTALTCLTLIILTFTIMSFTTVNTMRRQNKLSFAEQGSYQGVLLKDIGWTTLPRDTLSTFGALFKGEVTTGPRVWFSAEDSTRAARIQVNVQKRPFLLQGLAGFSFKEPQVSGLDTILLKGRWFSETEPHSVLIPASLAARINIDPDKPDQPPLILWGIPFQVTGIFSEKMLQQFVDLDGEIMTPAIFPSESIREMTEVEKEALESGEDVQNFQGRYRHINTDQILILPANTLLRLGGELKSVALKLPVPMTDETVTTLTDRFNLTLFSSEPDGVYVYNASDTMQYSGMPNIVIPLIISILIVLNTMISSVYERKKEIAVYTSVGLAPTHVSFLFIAEALAFAVLSVVLGYLMAQTSAEILAGTRLWEGITVNYSSTAGVAAMILVMGVVLLSVIYPSRVAAQIAIPDVNRSWVMPEAENDTLTVSLPFLMRYHEHASICGFLYGYFTAHQDVSHGIFATGPVEVIDAAQMGENETLRLPMADDCLHIRAKVWLAPFDFGIMQWVDLRFCHAKEGENFLQISVRMTRKAGEFSVWKRVNTAFIHDLRKQLLVWRSLEAEGHEQYRELLASATRSAAAANTTNQRERT